MPGDVIQGLEGKPIRNGADMQAALDDHDPRAEVALTVWRDGEEREVAIVLGAP